MKKNQLPESYEESGGDLDRLPKGWIRARLPDVALINMGQSPPGKSYNTEGAGLPFFQGKADFGERCPSVRVWCSDPRKVAHAGDVLLSVRAPVGPTNLADRTCAIGRGLAAISPKNGTASEYIFFALRRLEQELALRGTGSTFTAISKRDIEEIEIDLPTLNEQKRIVAKIGELLPKVNAVRERLIRVKVIMKRFRQSVLSAACSGRLTEDWREDHLNVTPARVSINEISNLRQQQWAMQNGLGKRYKPPRSLEEDGRTHMPESWEYVSSDALFIFVTSGSRGWAKYYSESGPIFIRVGNLNHNSIALDLSRIQHVDPPRGAEHQRTGVRGGDILISITADVGMIGLVPEHIGEAYINQHVAISRPVDGVYRPFVAWYLASGAGGQALFEDLQRGATKVGLGLDDIKSLRVPFPPIEEQWEIVHRVEALFKLSEKIAKNVEAELSRTEKMTQSILAKAFRGELVPTEAELARREGRSEESAQKRLARITAEHKQDSQTVFK